MMRRNTFISHQEESNFDNQYLITLASVASGFEVINDLARDLRDRRHSLLVEFYRNNRPVDAIFSLAQSQKFMVLDLLNISQTYFLQVPPMHDITLHTLKRLTDDTKIKNLVLI